MTLPFLDSAVRSGRKLTASDGSVVIAPASIVGGHPNRKPFIMTASLAPHLNFTGNAREALAFYGRVFGTEPVLRTYGEFGMPAGLPDTDRVVWGQVATSDGVRIMAYDVPTQQPDVAATQLGSTRRESGLTVTDQPYFLALSNATIEDATAVWEGARRRGDRDRASRCVGLVRRFRDADRRLRRHLGSRRAEFRRPLLSSAGRAFTGPTRSLGERWRYRAGLEKPRRLSFPTLGP